MLNCDSDTDIEDEFFTALALFKSTAKSSEVKLREMLLTAIAKRTKFFNHDIKIPFPASITDNLNEMSKTKINDNIEKQLENFENILCDSINEENSRDSSDIPTISIPDEEFTDFTTCKICDGAKIGPFILLECQECLDTYHPLCHQPPVIEIDIYDPRLVWRCSRCTSVCEEIPPEISSTLNSSDENLNINNDNEEKMEKINEKTSVKSNSLNKIKNYSYMRNNIEERGTLKDTVKEEYSSLGNQLRKRIGSKLQVSRGKI